MTFYDWLMTNKHRLGPVGDLARDAAGDVKFRRRRKLESLAEYLQDLGACDGALFALKDAWTEYELYAKGAPVIPRIAMLGAAWPCIECGAELPALGEDNDDEWVACGRCGKSNPRSPRRPYAQS
ncbi:MAG: YozE family protein [Bryobacteraceae bacterium]